MFWLYSSSFHTKESKMCNFSWDGYRFVGLFPSKWLIFSRCFASLLFDASLSELLSLPRCLSCLLFFSLDYSLFLLLVWSSFFFFYGLTVWFLFFTWSRFNANICAILDSWLCIPGKHNFYFISLYVFAEIHKQTGWELHMDWIEWRKNEWLTSLVSDGK